MPRKPAITFWLVSTFKIHVSWKFGNRWSAAGLLTLLRVTGNIFDWRVDESNFFNGGDAQKMRLRFRLVISYVCRHNTHKTWLEHFHYNANIPTSNVYLLSMSLIQLSQLTDILMKINHVFGNHGNKQNRLLLVGHWEFTHCLSCINVKKNSE